MSKRHTPFDVELFEGQGDCPICHQTCSTSRKSGAVGRPLQLAFYRCRICGNFSTPSPYYHNHGDGFSGRWQLSAVIRSATVQERPPFLLVMHSDETNEDQNIRLADEFGLELIWIENVAV